MKTYLVLGARSPASLEIVRGLARSGNRVLAADSMRYPVTKWSRHVERYFRLPDANASGELYGDVLARIVRENGVDVVIPTCEEVFHLSMSRGLLPEGCVAFAEDIAKLKTMHDKYAFTEAAKDCGVGVPRTILIRSRRRLADTWERSMTDCEIVYKRVYSRFAEGTLVKPTLKRIDKVYPSTSQPWIAQEFIEGDEVCCYAVAVDGRLNAIAPYRPLHRAGKGAGICFAPVRSPEIEAFVASIVAKHSFTGQISFDFIVSPDRGAFVIECNPRATSGVHLLPRDTDWASVFAGTSPRLVVPSERTAMVGGAMATFGLATAFKSDLIPWTKDWLRSKDVVWDAKDPMPAIGQWVATGEMLTRAFRWRTSALAASTLDIEWNG